MDTILTLALDRAAAQRIRDARPSGCPDHPSRADELRACAESFRHFLRWWHFKNREAGEVLTFAHLWPGQEMFAEACADHEWVIALKAGKLGFTELECAYDGWVARFRSPNARVHLFSKDATASKELLKFVKFGLVRLPEWMRLPILDDEAGGDTARSLMLTVGPDDTRQVVAYAAGKAVSIDMTASHAHVDELARMPFASETWAAIESTVAGTCHIVSRGAGEFGEMSALWTAATQGVSKLHPLFVPYHMRPGRDRTWRETQTMNHLELSYFAPETPEDALAGDDVAQYMPMPAWDARREDLPALSHTESVVIGVDAAVSGDCFAIVAATRHPARHDDPAVRAVKVWNPKDSGGRIDFEEPERFLRWLCLGGCEMGHPQSMPGPGCRLCEEGRWEVPRHNVVCIAYDPYQLEDMMQRFTRERVAWCEAFNQGALRLEADSMLLRLTLQGRLAHTGDAKLREHIGNAMAKLSKDEDRSVRIVKRSPDRKVDAAVAASMAVHQALYLNI